MDEAASGVTRIVMTSHNRVGLTERAVRQVLRSADDFQIDVVIFLLDDNSTDDTSSRLRGLDPRVNVIDGDGEMYWARGMATAEEAALAYGTGGYLLWLNDDVDLNHDALATALDEASRCPNAVVIGATCDPVDSSTVTYGGLVWRGPHPLKYVRASLGQQGIDSFNGNFVLVPFHIAKQMGGIEGRYSHALADIDYGVRLRRAGVRIIQLDHAVGRCATNAQTHNGTYNDWKSFTGIKGGGNPASLRIILPRLRPFTWPFWFFATYAKWALNRTIRLGRRP